MEERKKPGPKPKAEQNESIKWPGTGRTKSGTLACRVRHPELGILPPGTPVELPAEMAASDPDILSESKANQARQRFDSAVEELKSSGVGTGLLRRALSELGGRPVR